MNPAIKDLETLPVLERLQIVEDLWDSIARSNESLAVPQWQRDELDRRKQHFSENPEETLSWDQVKEQVFKSL